MSTQYHYEPLGPGDFRILHIRPGRKEDLIRCCLQIQNIHTSQETEYSALSYAWGSIKRTETIILEGFSFLVTHNLHSALWHARESEKTVSLWADAVCINQADMKERGHQVAQMRSIYRSAARVIIWLGEATVESDNAMEFICHGTPDRDLLSNKDVLELFYRPWWKRIWVIQEVASAQSDPIIRCGKKEVFWSSLRRIRGKVPFQGWIQFAMQMQELIRFASGANGLGDMVNAVAHAQMFVEAVDRLRRGSVLPWIDAFALGYIMKSTDPRDLIFALMGLFNEQGIPPFVPDYRKDAISVQCEAAAASLQYGGGLDTLTLTVSPSRNHLPTWAPDMVNGEPGIFLVTDTGVYRAAGKTTAHLRWSQGHRVLHASGMVCDTVVDIVYDQRGESKESLKAFDRAKDLAYEFGKRSELDNFVTRDRFWRTMIVNQGRSSYGAYHADLRYPAPQYLGDRYMAWQKEIDIPDEAIGPGEAFEWHMKYIEPYFTSRHAMDNTGRWSFFTTRSGRFGLGQGDVMAGDPICILHGGRVTYTLRKVLNHYIFVGCAYVHGIMDGEIADDLSDTECVQEFEIH
jgi:hypothetical protein